MAAGRRVCVLALVLGGRWPWGQGTSTAQTTVDPAEVAICFTRECFQVPSLLCPVLFKG